MSYLRLAAIIVLFTFAGCSSCDDDTGGNSSTNSGTMDAGGNNQTDAGGNNQADAGGNNQTDGGADSGADAATCDTVECNGVCCAADQECVMDACLDPCDGTRCGADLSTCCRGVDLCLSDACVTPTGPCAATEDCQVDEICEPTVGQCVPRDSVEVCEFIPPVVPFAPEIGCTWPSGTIAVRPSSDRVVVTPIVGNLTDDNGDGVTDENDSPEIVFLSRTSGCCNKRGTLRIVDGQCNPDGTMNTIASLDGVVMTNDNAPALGDLDGDGVAEVVAVKGQNLQSNDKVTPQGLVAWKRMSDDGTSWAPLWENDTYPTFNVHTRGGAAVSIADLDGDSNPEIIVGNVVLNGQTGDLKWDGVATSGGTGGIGNNAFLGPSSSVGDVDLDGNQEVAAGNTLYDHDGTVLWTYEYTTSNSPCGGSLPCDGFTAMAEFDGDPEGEVVIIRQGELFILNHDGTLFWQQAIIKDDCDNNESGPPTVADFDGDGRPEVGTAAADFYTVMDLDCDVDDWSALGCRARGVLWATPNNDCSSRVTASSVFDFEGDGKAEMVYADENNFRIFDGTTGAILFDDPTHSSNTRLEMPLVADVDNDGNSEIVVPSDTAQSIKVIQDPGDNWVRTRRVWNQHAYSVTNVNEDGTIPAVPQINWQNGRLNNFRQNTQPGGLFDAPNLLIESIEATGLGCGGSLEALIRVTVTNAGALGMPAGTPVRIYGRSGGATTTIADTTLQSRLLPGQSELIEVTYNIPQDWIDNGFEIGAIVDPDSTVNECIEDDNEATISGDTIEFSTPDLVISALTADGLTCGTNGNMNIAFTVRNDGTQPAPPSTPIVVTGDGVEVDTLRTQGAIRAGGEQMFTLTWQVPPAKFGRNVTIVATVDPNQEVYMCDDQNSETVMELCRVPQ